MRFAGPFPRLARDCGLLARPLGLPLGFFDPLAGALELFFGDPHPLPRHLRQQTRTLYGLGRLPGGGRVRPGSFGAVTRAGAVCAGG
jgi:hypothetical protein